MIYTNRKNIPKPYWLFVTDVWSTLAKSQRHVPLSFVADFRFIGKLWPIVKEEYKAKRRELTDIFDQDGEVEYREGEMLKKDDCMNDSVKKLLFF